MNFVEELENLIVLLAIMRARLQPCISYPRAESITTSVRMALTSPMYEAVIPAKPTATLIEACGIVSDECTHVLTTA
ncbi:hypothetical protein [Kozakia baliensis]|uniref:hypothetical protein n=1 Tax=Kozakia baliensis TaxID=153496 RepID=UPI000497356A|nr:hypothetical protein [Kozakia baliensis]